MTPALPGLVARAEKALEVDCFKGALQKVKARRQRRAAILASWHLRPNPRSDATETIKWSSIESVMQILRCHKWPPRVLSDCGVL